MKILLPPKPTRQVPDQTCLIKTQTRKIKAIFLSTIVIKKAITLKTAPIYNKYKKLLAVLAIFTLITRVII